MHGSLASVDTALLRQMRDSALRSCFRRMDETAHRMEHVATIHGKEYINDAAARSVNATLYTMQNITGPVVWIAMAADDLANYTPLQTIALRKVDMLICVGGRGYYREWGKDPVEMTAGTVVNIPPEVKHWHGAANDSWFAHLAIEIDGEGTSNEWLEPVNDGD